MATPGSFDARVYALVAAIPPGRVVTYGGIARSLGFPRCARRVGQAMSRAPSFLDLPCHRVVTHRGDMAPGAIFGGEGRQRSLLGGEGVPFTPDGRVDLRLCLWVPPEDRYDASHPT